MYINDFLSKIFEKWDDDWRNDFSIEGNGSNKKLLWGDLTDLTWFSIEHVMHDKNVLLFEKFKQSSILAKVDLRIGFNCLETFLL